MPLKHFESIQKQMIRVSQQKLFLKCHTPALLIHLPISLLHLSPLPQTFLIQNVSAAHVV
jgi:hypothetical protein